MGYPLFFYCYCMFNFKTVMSNKKLVQQILLITNYFTNDKATHEKYTVGLASYSQICCSLSSTYCIIKEGQAGKCERKTGDCWQECF